MTTQRETIGSRLGFLLLSAGCAIGIGNVWRFPYITGEYGGALFVLFYIFFLLFVGLPVLTMEFTVGRAAQLNMGGALRKLEPKGTHWHKFGWMSIVGSYLLMMFYTTVTGWMLAYCWLMGSGKLSSLSPEGVGQAFGSMIMDPKGMFAWMTVAVFIGFISCYMGLRDGVERIVKWMMSILLILMVALAIHSITLPGAAEGLSFYLAPDFSKITHAGIWSVLAAAMNQAFFTLSVGIGSMCIFGSYLTKERSLTGEAMYIVILDTFVAIVAGLIIFPACFSFDVHPNAGPGLLFVTLPNVFNAMDGGQFWGTIFFIFMSFAALSTVIAVFENIISYAIDVWGMTRKKAAIVNCLAIWILSIPCILGFNEWSEFQPLGKGTGILDLEDFLVSSTLLPLGSLLFLLFCTQRWGWGWNDFLKECNTGQGLRFPAWLRVYLTYVLPLIILALFAHGYYNIFGKFFD